MKLSNIKKIKSTLLGLALILLAVFLLVKSITHDYYILTSLFFVGLSLFFTGDSTIEKLEKLIFGKIIEIGKKPVADNNNQTDNGN